ncbi:MAG TPA: outer membrane beta-barrel protein [Rhizomicrobium sp.]|nr:outer membrane beta-barrel protein [Rhizomicrobium sp.]
MRNLIIASAATLLLGTLAAQADSYVSVLGGPTFAPGLNVSGTTHGMDTGFNVGARVGTSLDTLNLPDFSNFSIEADGLFNQSNYSGIANARLQSSSYMGNLIYHLPMDGPFELYGGAGLGAVSTNIDNGVGNHGGSTVLGWQALGGVEYRASDQASLFAEYRYQNAHDVNAGGLTNIGNTSNNLSFGVKWHL